MGSSQSTHAANKSKASSPGGKEQPTDMRSVSGLKTIEPVEDSIEVVDMPSSEEEVSSLIDDESSDSEDEDDDDEEDEEMMERILILDEARMLKQLAQAFLYPEQPVVADPTAFGRNYYGRASAPDQETEEDANERAQILEDMAALKKTAVAYAHTEVPVVTTDPTACGRNYFDRASAPEQEDDELADERAEILAEMAALKKQARVYAHPEEPIVVDPSACGRNYFDRASVPEQETLEETEERDEIFAEMAALKKLAVNYAHPEEPVVTTDATACGRNYYGRASAPEQEMESAEHDAIMQDMRALKKLAVDYLHPERPVATTDSTACGRNYFDRASAPEQEDDELADERVEILAEMAALKEQACVYAHPERPAVADPTLFGRNYYGRASAPEQETEEEVEEREQVLAEMQTLKKLAIEYAHPELGVVTTDSTACGRNYFGRASAPDQETEEEAEERDQILAEVMALKKTAVEYAHPEVPVVTTDATACGRNYFGRASAPEQESAEDAEEHAQIMADALALKKTAVDFAHPELPIVTTDATACGRNYFGRASAVEQETDEEAEERAHIMADLMALKKFAVDYAHPEEPLVTTDATACGRNYYARPSAAGRNFISSTAEDPIPEVDDYATEYAEHLEEHDLHWGNFEMEEDLYSGMKVHLHQALGDSHFHKAVPKESSNEEEEEEGKLSRSPSSVMLFGGELAY